MVDYTELIEFLDNAFWGNTVAEYLTALLVFLAALVVFKLFREVALTRLRQLAQRTPTDLDVTLVEIVRSLRPPFYVILSVYVAVLFITVPPIIFQVVVYALIIAVGFQVSVGLSMLVDYVVAKRTEKEGDLHAQAAIGLLGRMAKGVVWVVVVLFVLANMGINITSFIAAMGIGGVAIALALQSILGDLFSSFSIYFDKPFEVGDFIMVGEHMGVVEKIGIKTTRLRALQGEEIVISNQELTSARIQNFKKLRERRIVFHFGVTYDTPNEKLERISELVEKIVIASEHSRFDRAHFYRFDDSALTFEVVYYLLSSDYNDYMDTQEAINLHLKESLEELGVSFAYPTRTVYMHQT